jgi:2'-5' RNA ligase
MLEPSLGESETKPVNCFALVSYIPGQLGRFLDEVRRELEPATQAPRAHITLLPPRCLCDTSTAPQAAEEFLERALVELPAVEIYLGPIRIFPGTNVVYVSVDGGFLQLRMMHEKLNAGPLRYVEPFHYHPHVTLAQGLTPAQAERVCNEATRRWDLYQGSRQFSTDSFSFVQANSANRWADLAEYSLAPAVR